LGLVALKQGKYAQAAEHLQEGLRLYQARGDKRHVAATHHSLGRLAQAQGNHAGALEHLRVALDLYREMVDKLGMAESLEATALSVASEEVAVRLLAAAHTLRQAIGAPVPPVEREVVEHRVEELRTRLGATAFTAAWAAGVALSPEQAVAGALA
jgi:tetratricopeptide (TPR) repeat protein